MTVDSPATAAAQAEAWQQLYKSWLELIGADAVIDTINQCNEDALQGLRAAMDPAWKIPLQWLEDMTRVMETNHVPEPVKSQAITMATIGKTCLEAGERCSTLWLRNAPAMCLNGKDIYELWLEPIRVSEYAWREVSDYSHSFAAGWANQVASLSLMPKGAVRDPLDADVMEPEVAAVEKTEVAEPVPRKPASEAPPRQSARDSRLKKETQPATAAAAAAH